MAHDAAAEQLQQAVTAYQPASLPGLVATWPACLRWRGPAGLQRLQDLAGNEHVQVDFALHASPTLSCLHQPRCLPSLLHWVLSFRSCIQAATSTLGT